MTVGWRTAARRCAAAARMVSSASSSRRSSVRRARGAERGHAEQPPLAVLAAQRGAEARGGGRLASLHLPEGQGGAVADDALDAGEGLEGVGREHAHGAQAGESRGALTRRLALRHALEGEQGDVGEEAGVAVAAVFDEALVGAERRGHVAPPHGVAHGARGRGAPEEREGEEEQSRRTHARRRGTPGAVTARA
ncbi:MAG: hypothetical protein U0325_02445 [Polyangiales bacterium]